MTDLSIVVVTWNTRQLVVECLASIESVFESWGESPPLKVETWIVDNGSTDGTAEAIRQRFSFARLIELPENVGFAVGCNTGIRRAGGRVVLLLNSDTRLGSETLEHCVAYLDAHPAVGIVGPQLRGPDGSKQNSIHNFPIVATELVPKAIFQFFFRKRFPSRRWSGGEPLDVEAVRGAALFARREVIQQVGALPEEYFFFLEETDWCYRVRRAGWRVVFLPSVFVTHLSGASSKKKNPALTRIEYHRSLYRFYRNNRGIGWMATVVLLRLAKSLFYVLTQAPLAVVGGANLTRWKTHRDVLLWHLRGCPADVGIRQLDAPAGGKSARTRSRS